MVFSFIIRRTSEQLILDLHQITHSDTESHRLADSLRIYKYIYMSGDEFYTFLSESDLWPLSYGP